MKETALLTIHGMGCTGQYYYRDIEYSLMRRLDTLWNDLYFGSIYYQDLLQINQDRVWSLMRQRLRCSPWNRVRRFFLFGFADAPGLFADPPGLETQKARNSSPYFKAQVRIAEAMWRAFDALADEGRLVVIAQSLGGQVFSNYLWDAQKWFKGEHLPKEGIWTNPQHFACEIAGKGSLTEREVDFIGGRTLRCLYTTGCNIPLFVSAHPEIAPIDKPCSDFEWHNYYDKDDVLGWPLGELSRKYGELVQDHEINSTGSCAASRLFKSWNPLCHSEYWNDDDVLNPLAARLRKLLRE